MTTKSSNDGKVRYLFVRTKDGIAAIHAGLGQDAWSTIVGGGAQIFASVMDSNPNATVRGRFFQMHPGQAREWDRLIKHGRDGYVYGIGWDPDSKIARNFQFKEVGIQSADAGAAFGPLGVMMAVQSLQLQAQLEGMESKIDRLTLITEDVRAHLRREQRAQALMVIETINDLYGGLVENGTVSVVNADRARQLEPSLKQSANSIADELLDLTGKLKVSTTKDAKEVMQEGLGSRAAAVSALAGDLAVALGQWGMLLLADFIERQAWNQREVNRALASLSSGRNSLSEAQEGLLVACQPGVLERSWDFPRLLMKGVPYSIRQDNQIQQLVDSERSDARDLLAPQPSIAAATTSDDGALEALRILQQIPAAA